MLRGALLLLLLPLVSCGEAGERNAVSASRNEAKQRPVPPPQFAQSTHPDSIAAAAALRHYYDLISRRAFREAWAMRAADPGRAGVSYEAFEANYARYRRYDAVVAGASLPAEGDGFVFVTVQVQLTGTLADGAPFGMVGTVTMRRAAQGSAAARAWKVTS